MAWRDSRMRGFERSGKRLRRSGAARSRKSVTSANGIGIQYQDVLSGPSDRGWGNRGGGCVLAPKQRDPVTHLHQVVFGFGCFGFRDRQLRLQASIRGRNHARQRRSDRLVAAVRLELAKSNI